jgi:hypothetical protein
MISNNGGSKKLEKTTEFEQSQLSSIGLRKQEHELLRLVSLSPFISRSTIQLIYPDSKADLERLKQRSLLAVSKKGEYALTRLGWSFLSASRVLQSSEPTSATSTPHSQNPTTTVMVTADGRSHIEGQLVMSLSEKCAYATCGDVAVDGVVVTLVNSDGTLEHRTYCCEMHAAFHMLSIAHEDAPGMVTKEAVLDMVSRSLDGEPIVAVTFDQPEVDDEVEAILKRSYLAPGGQA